MNVITYLLAQAPKPEPIDPGTIGVPVVTSSDSVLTNVLNVVYTWAGIISVLIIIIAGYFFVTAAGDPTQVRRARNAIIGACVGLIVIIMAFVITQYVIGRF